MTEENGHQTTAENSPEEQPPPPTPGRFRIRALPDRRAFYTRRELIILAVAALGAVAIGLWAAAEWLAFQPRQIEATPTEVPLPSPSSESAQITATASPTPEPTKTVPTRTPTPTRTPSPTATARVRASPRPTETPTPLPAPLLLHPHDGATPSRRVTFEWRWEGPPLGENQAFDLRIWSILEQERGATKRGAIAPTQDSQASVDLPFVPTIQDSGPGDYFWTVVVVEIRNGAGPVVISEWGEARRFVYR